MSEKRKLKVYESSDKNYIPTPTIILKGKWLGKYGFDMNTLISVNCEERRITIEPRDPDPIVVDEAIDGFLKSLSKKELRSLKRTLQSSKI
jgi:hypothetical protein